MCIYIYIYTHVYIQNYIYIYIYIYVYIRIAGMVSIRPRYLVVGGGNAAGYACREFVAQGAPCIQTTYY